MCYWWEGKRESPTRAWARYWLYSSIGRESIQGQQDITCSSSAIEGSWGWDWDSEAIYYWLKTENCGVHSSERWSDW